MLINVHMGPPTGEGGMKERFDTLGSPAGTVATLLNIEEKLGLTDIIGIDESFPGVEGTRKKIEEIIEHDNKEGRRTFLLFTMLLYNAERSVKYIHELKQAYGEKITIAVGGQLMPFAEKAYEKNSDIDIVCVGDAEMILPQLIRDLRGGGFAGELQNGDFKHRYEGWVKDSLLKKFDGVSYDRFWMIRERMTEQKRETAAEGKRNARGELGFTQLTIQGPGGPGCAWASSNENGPCSFCGLTNITEMSKTTLREALRNEAEVAKKFDVDRFFDVANQFLPTMKKSEAKEWLKEYIDVRTELGMTNKKYAYLTVNSIDPEIASLLKQAGITEVYLGIDHFHPDALTEQNKPFRTEIRHGGQLVRGEKISQPNKKDGLVKALDALKEAGIFFRAGIVLGAAHESPETLEAVREGARWLFENYPNAEHVGVFPVEIIPGSKLFAEMKKDGMCPEIFKKFEDKGYLSRDEQRELTRTFVEKRSKVDFEAIEGLRNEIEEMTGKAYSVDEFKIEKKMELHREFRHKFI